MSDEREIPNGKIIRYGPASFKKEERLRLSSDFEYVRANGVKKIGSFLILLIAPPRSSLIRAGFVCSRKFSNKAVLRNRAKRIMKEVFSNSKYLLDKCELIMIPRKHLLVAKTGHVQSEFIRLMKELGKWNGL